MKNLIHFGLKPSKPKVPYDHFKLNFHYLYQCALFFVFSLLPTVLVILKYKKFS